VRRNLANGLGSEAKELELVFVGAQVLSWFKKVYASYVLPGYLDVSGLSPCGLSSRYGRRITSTGVVYTDC